MRVLVLQHIAVEHPGIFRDFLAAAGVAWDAVELNSGERIPPLERYDMLWAMGGPMDVWEEDAHPWLVREKAAIREWVQTGKAFFGVCLGHQLLADALGGRVGPAPAAEVGILPVALTAAGRADPLFRGIAPAPVTLQWHGAAVLDPPPDTLVLARSPACPVQAIRVGDRAYGLQFHIEATAATVPEWGGVPAYETALERAMGAGACARFETETAAVLPQLNATARRLYDNLMALARDDSANA